MPGLNIFSFFFCLLSHYLLSLVFFSENAQNYHEENCTRVDPVPWLPKLDKMCFIPFRKCLPIPFKKFLKCLLTRKSRVFLVQCMLRLNKKYRTPRKCSLKCPLRCSDFDLQIAYLRYEYISNFIFERESMICYLPIICAKKPNC